MGLPEILGTAGTLEVDLDALAANWHLLAARAGTADCAAVVKADGYGLGGLEVARRLQAEGCRWFFVAHLEEAVALRTVVPDHPVFALNGTVPGIERSFVEHDVVPVLNDLSQIERWNALARQLGRRLPAAIHLDTGMNRLGLSRGEIERLARQPELLDATVVRLWISHLACSEIADSRMNQEQRQRFDAALAVLPRAPASLANSSGIFLDPGYRYHVVRAGAALYGINPLPGQLNPMAGVVRLSGKILQIHDVDTNQAVGYGAAWRAAGPSRIATVAIGYADGYLRALSNRGIVAIAGKRVPVVGRVSMDLITIDVTEIGDVPLVPGDVVELIGPTIPVDEVATAADTIGYEILTQLGRRYHRRYQGAVA